MDANAGAQGAVSQPQPEAALPFREAMRKLAASVAIVTTRDADGSPHGMVASSVIAVSMDPPSMLVAVNRTAGLHPVLARSQRFCVNLLSDRQHPLLQPFSQSSMRDQRFRQDDWRDAWNVDAEWMPWLSASLAAIACTVEQAVDYGTHTLFIGRVTGVRLDAADVTQPPQPPLVWFAGQRAALATAV